MGWWRCEGISWPVGKAPGLVLSWTWWWASFFDHQQISTATFTRANLNHLPLGGSQKLGLAESRWMMGVMVLQGAIGSLRRRVFDTFHDRLQWRACGGGSLPAAWHVGHGEVAFSGSAVPQTLPKDTQYLPVNPTWQWKITHLVISHESFGLVRVWLPKGTQIHFLARQTPGWLPVQTRRSAAFGVSQRYILQSRRGGHKSNQTWSSKVAMYLNPSIATPTRWTHNKQTL